MYRRLNKIIGRFINRIKSVNRLMVEYDIVPSSILTISFLIVVIIFLMFSIFDVYKRSDTNIARIEAEKLKVEDLREEEKKIIEDIEYYSSARFIEGYSRENLDLGRTDELLIRFDDGEIPEYELEERNTDPIEIDANGYWWKKIFLW